MSGGCPQVAAHELGSCRTWALERGLQLLWPKGSVVVVNGLTCTRTCGIFLYQESYSCPLHWQVDSLLLDHQGSPMAIHFLSFKKKISYLVTFFILLQFYWEKIDCIQLVKVKATQSCLTHCNPRDYTVHGILQAILQNTGVFQQPFPSPGDLPNPGIEPRSPALQVDSFPAEPPGKQ